MAKPRFAVQHFVACPGVEVQSVAIENPHTLRDVNYTFEVPAEREWPVRLDDFWVYARFFNGIGRREFSVQVHWLDARLKPVEVCEFLGINVVFPVGYSVISRAWRFDSIRFPGPGRYLLRLRDGVSRRVLAREFIQLRKLL